MLSHPPPGIEARGGAIESHLPSLDLFKSFMLPRVSLSTVVRDTYAKISPCRLKAPVVCVPALKTIRPARIFAPRFPELTLTQ